MINNIAKLLQGIFGKKKTEDILKKKLPITVDLKPEFKPPEFKILLSEVHLTVEPEGANQLDVRIGDLAAKYETSGKGVGYISTGMGGKDPGGISYGNYQLETKLGTMQAYLKSKEGGKYAKELNKFTVNSTNFKNKWKQLAKDDPVGFNYSQFLYLANKPNGYNDAIKYAKQLGWAVDNFAMQSAIYSTVNQSGGWKTGIFNKAGIKKTDNVKDQLNKLYDARAAYFKRIKLDATVKRNIIKNRTVDERRDAIRLV